MIGYYISNEGLIVHGDSYVSINFRIYARAGRGKEVHYTKASGFIVTKSCPTTTGICLFQSNVRDNYIAASG